MTVVLQETRARNPRSPGGGAAGAAPGWLRGAKMHDCLREKVRNINSMRVQAGAFVGQFFVGNSSNTIVETAYKVAICPRRNLLYMGIYLITDLKVLWKAFWGFNLSTL